MFFKKKGKNRILVTGSSGLVGKALVEALSQRGMEVVGCDIKEPDKKNFIFEKCNLSCEEEIFRLFQKCDFKQVVHLAAYIQSGDIDSIIRKRMFQSNIEATFNLLSAMEKHGVEKIVFASSMTVYGLPKYLPVDENHPLNPLDFYGFSKVTAEEIIKRFNVNYFILRFPGIFVFNRKEGAVYNFISKALKGENIHILAKSPTPWEVIFIEDVINSIIATLSKEIESCILNIGYGEPVELVTLAKRIVKLCVSRSKVIKDYSVSHPTFCLSTKKGKSILSFNPSSLDFRLNQFINFLKHER